MDVFVLARDFSSLADLRARVRRWESAGAAGVLIPDHLFTSAGGLLAEAPCPDPVPVLAAIGAMAPRLQLGTFVMNATLGHLVLIARHFAQLAALFGGERVIAGLGAGWNREEFDALGGRMPPHPERLGQFGTAIGLIRSLLADAAASPDAGPRPDLTRRLRLPPAATAPRFLLGGGSDGFLRIAGAAADWVDFNGSSRRASIGRTQPAAADGIRRLTTTVADLEESARRLDAAARAAGREPAEIRRSVFIDTIDYCPGSEIAERESRLRAGRGAGPVAVGQCPYVLIGPEAQLRDALAERAARLSLSAIIVADSGPLERVLGMADLPRC
jgi:alkanesulfonate monooxygenase SsuD/methylene tetrahydromethanopterin reductase-like flavin-dependent oxidoreductase (luciferase family)